MSGPKFIRWPNPSAYHDVLIHGPISITKLPSCFVNPKTLFTSISKTTLIKSISSKHIRNRFEAKKVNTIPTDLWIPVTIKTPQISNKNPKLKTKTKTKNQNPSLHNLQWAGSFSLAVTGNAWVSFLFLSIPLLISKSDSDQVFFFFLKQSNQLFEFVI